MGHKSKRQRFELKEVPPETLKAITVLLLEKKTYAQVGQYLGLKPASVEHLSRRFFGGRKGISSWMRDGTKAKVAYIKEGRSEGKTYAELARDLGMTRQAAQLLAQQYIAGLERPKTIEGRKQRLLYILGLVTKGKLCWEELADKLGLSYDATIHLLRRSKRISELSPLVTKIQGRLVPEKSTVRWRVKVKERNRIGARLQGVLAVAHTLSGLQGVADYLGMSRRSLYVRMCQWRKRPELAPIILQIKRTVRCPDR